MSDLCGGRKLRVCFPPLEAQIKTGLTAPPGPLSPRLFFSMAQNSWPPSALAAMRPRTTSVRRVVTARGRSSGCYESLLHLSLCCQSASEASLSRQFPRASVTPPREEKKTNPVAAAPADHVQGSRSQGHRGFELLSDKKESDMLSQCETGEYQWPGRVVILRKPRQHRETAQHCTLRLPC